MMLPNLVLGNYRYLDVFGNVHPARKVFTDAEIKARLRINPDFDPQEESAPNTPTRLTDENREYWEKAAAKGGHTLDELLAE
ncbi:hypothetical protein [Rhodococcus sp. B10]|uniref:hypothetical protein n=1 Tax=Rhodococcus sp. B10 TaxID=2695876 RepID=UPI00142F5368|nr:hypothetical protein [Rhodococcus sp. B10]NIL77613.1 hypothetical protein [Rhodococcus sp. B10]